MYQLIRISYEVKNQVKEVVNAARLSEKRLFESITRLSLRDINAA